MKKNNVIALFISPILCVLMVCLAGAAEPAHVRHPLEPPDRSSPRATLTNFLADMNKAVRAFQQGQRDQAEALVRRSSRYMDIEREPPALRYVMGLYASLYLKETLDRLEIPPLDEIPDAKAVQADKLSSWTLPFTEITIALAKEPAPSGTFLFTSETVRNAERFYDRVKHLPYLPGTGGGALVDQLSATEGMLIPKGLIGSLPQWAKARVGDQAIWQWIGLIVFLIIGAGIVFFLYKGVRIALGMVDRKFDWNLKHAVGGLVLPMAIIVLARAGLWFVVYGLHFNADVYVPVAFVLMSLVYVGAIWLIAAILNRIAGFVIAKEGLARGSIDSQLIRLLFQMFTLVIIAITVIKLGARLGLPTYSLVTGLGVGGLAVALAGRDALSNLIGTIIILLEKPFTLGDFIALDDGLSGTVSDVGLRSTRVRTRDGILVSIPNSTVANMKIVNQSAPVSTMRVHVPIGVAYASDVKQVEQTLLAVAAHNEYAVPDPAPSVRFLGFGDSALQFELLVWIQRPEYKGRAINQLNRAINEEFRQKGIEMPFPQREVLIRRNVSVHREG